MTSPKRDAPNHVANRKKSGETVPTSIQQSGGLAGDNAGIAQGRKTEMMCRARSSIRMTGGTATLDRSAPERNRTLAQGVVTP